LSSVRPSPGKGDGLHCYRSLCPRTVEGESWENGGLVGLVCQGREPRGFLLSSMGWNYNGGWVTDGVSPCSNGLRLHCDCTKGLAELKKVVLFGGGSH